VQTRRNNQMIRSNNRCDLFRMSYLNGVVSRKLSTSAFLRVAWSRSCRSFTGALSFFPNECQSGGGARAGRQHTNTRTHVGHVGCVPESGSTSASARRKLQVLDGRHRGRESKFPPRLASPTSEFRSRKIRVGADQSPCPLIEPTLATTPPPLPRGAPFIRCNS
jgi:hypothetical protein